MGGLELIMNGVPYGMSDTALKKRLVPFLKIDYDFLVILTKYAEDLFWESRSDPSVTNSARIIIPDTGNQYEENPGRDLYQRGVFSFPYKNRMYNCTVGSAQDPQTTNNRYDQIRKTKLVVKAPVKAVRDGILGDILTISCGSFDDQNRFETTYKWSPRHDSVFNKFSYYGDAFPKKFQVCLTDSGPTEPFKWEWMDLHEVNICGIIFEGQPSQSESRRVVYFVVDKPPQFYQRTHIQVMRAGDGVKRYLDARISHPSLSGLSYHSNEVAGVSWVIQYSRVVKVEYEKREEFSFASYKPRLGQTQKDTLICSRHAIEQSTRTIDEMMLTLRNNLESIKYQFRNQRCPDCQIAVLKLFYNCNVCPLLQEAASAKDELFKILMEDDSTPEAESCLWTPYVRRNICDALKRSAQLMQTSQSRALRRIHSYPNTLSKFPVSAQPVVEPKAALNENLSRWFVLHPEASGLLSLEVFEVLVYPSHFQIHGPVASGLNSIIEEHQERIERFIRVRFVDNNEKPFRVEPGISADFIIKNRIVDVLLNIIQPLGPIGQRFEFLGSSVSSLKRKKAVWFFRDDHDDLNAEKIRATIGNWDVNDVLAKGLAKKPSKWGARVALAFTQSYPVAKLAPCQWACREDKGRRAKFPNTDGCGLISEELCEYINQKLLDLRWQPSHNFQIRFGGGKGVVYSGVQSLLSTPDRPKTNIMMLLRESQIKFKPPSSGDLNLRVVSTASDGQSSLFFGPLVKALEDSGVNTTKLEAIYNETYDNLTEMCRCGLDVLQELCRVSDEDPGTDLHARYILLRLAIRLKQHGIFPEAYENSFLKLYLVKLAERTRAQNLFEIPIPGSYQALGLTDDYQVLEEKEVYIRARKQTVTGDVLIYRDPIIHIGDIQKATAVTDHEIGERLRNKFTDTDKHFLAMTCMDNVIFFSQRDDPPFPNLLSGGDLDGDRFEILTGSENCDSWLHGFEASHPQSYVEDENSVGETQKVQPKVKDFDISELAKFIGQYIQNDCFAELQDIHMCLADEKSEGMKNSDVMDLATWLSQAVDYAKSGVKVDLYENVLNTDKFRVTAKPDFLRGLNRRASYDSKGGYYQSPKVLGRIYRKISELNYDVPGPVDDSTLKAAIARDLKLEHSEYERLQAIDNSGTREANAPLQATFEENVKSALGDYRRYLFTQNISQLPEVEIFLRKKLDSFPESQLWSLSRLVLGHLEIDGHVSQVQIQSNPQQVRYKLCDPTKRPFVKREYKIYLFRAWQILHRCAHRDPEHLGFGQSYAFLCLYALYCQKMPVEDET